MTCYRPRVHTLLNCHERLVDRVDSIGRIAHICPRCEAARQRFRARLCLECPRPLDSKSPRCPQCRIARQQAQDRALKRRIYATPVGHERALAAKRRSSSKPENRVKCRQRSKAWRERNKRPRNDIDRAYWRAMAASYRRDPVKSARRLRRRRQIYRAQCAARRAGLPVAEWRRFDRQGRAA